MSELCSQKTITYLDSSGSKQTVQPQKLWGYSKNNGVFIYYEKEFSRISVIGTLCHFTANVTQYMTVGNPGFGYGGYGGMGSMGPRTIATKELKQFMIDMGSGKIYDFSVDNMEFILQADPLLFAEFKALKKKEKRESTFLYLRKFNQGHPLYFPAN